MAWDHIPREFTPAVDAILPAVGLIQIGQHEAYESLVEYTRPDELGILQEFPICRKVYVARTDEFGPKILAYNPARRFVAADNLESAAETGLAQYTVPETDNVYLPTIDEAWEVARGILRGRFANATIVNMEDTEFTTEDVAAFIEEEYIINVVDCRGLHQRMRGLEPAVAPGITNEPMPDHEPLAWIPAALIDWHTLPEFTLDTVFDWCDINFVIMEPGQLPTYWFWTLKDPSAPRLKTIHEIKNEQRAEREQRSADLSANGFSAAMNSPRN